MIWLRASTSSPTRVISLSSRPTSTRIALSETWGTRASVTSETCASGITTEAKASGAGTLFRLVSGTCSFGVGFCGGCIEVCKLVREACRRPGFE